MLVPALQDAARDRSLHANDVRIFSLLLGELDPVDYRPVKNMYLCETLDLGKRTVIRSLQRLTIGGYLARENRSVNAEPRAYRVLYTRRVPPEAPPQAA